jgi:hypothetical protein
MSLQVARSRSLEPLYVHQAFAVLFPEHKVPTYPEVDIDPVLLAEVFAEEEVRFQKGVIPVMGQNMQTETKKASLDELVELGLLTANPLLPFGEPAPPVDMSVNAAVFSMTVDGVSPARIAKTPMPELGNIPTSLYFLGWRAPKPMTEPQVFHRLPAELKDAITPNSEYHEEFERRSYDISVEQAAANRAVDRRIFDHATREWLAMINEMDAVNVELEVMSGNGIKMASNIGGILYVEGLMNAVANELERLGYRVSYEVDTNTLLLDLKSGTFHWGVQGE